MILEQRLAVYQERLQELEKEEFPDEERRKFLQDQIASTQLDMELGVEYPVVQYPQKRKRFTRTDSLAIIQAEILNGRLVHIRPKFDWDRRVWVHDLETIPHY